MGPTLNLRIQSGHSGAVCQAASKISSSNYSSIFESDSECSSHIDSLSGSALRVVRLMKNNEPLGATAKIGDDGSLTVARIIKGGAADRSGLIHINDRIIEVNGIRAKKSNVEVRMRYKLYEMDLKIAVTEIFLVKRCASTFKMAQFKAKCGPF